MFKYPIGRLIIQDEDYLFKPSFPGRVLKHLANHYPGALIKGKTADPGGPAIEKAATSGIASLKLPRAWLKGTSDFSFSGVKTALLRLVEGNKVSATADAAASFQEAVVDVLVTKAVAAAKEYRVKQLLLAGGVASNKLLRRRLTENSPIPVLVPEPVLCTDNAAMIAACGYYRFKAGKIDSLDLDVIPGLKIA